MSTRIILSDNAGSPLFRISKPGADITSTTLTDFLVHEQLSAAVPTALLNITSLPYVTFTGGGVNQYTFVYAHGLAFTPIIIPMAAAYGLAGTVVGFSVFVTLGAIAGGTGAANILTFLTVDATNITLTMTTNYLGTSGSNPLVLSSPFIVAIFAVPIA